MSGKVQISQGINILYNATVSNWTIQHQTFFTRGADNFTTSTVARQLAQWSKLFTNKSDRMPGSLLPERHHARYILQFLGYLSQCSRTDKG